MATCGPNSSLQPTAKPLRGSPAAEFRRYAYMKKRKVLGSAIFVSLCAVALAWRLGLFAPSLSQIEGSPINETPLVDLLGHKHTFHELRGHPTTLYMWATWCAPCLKHLAQYAKSGPPQSSGYFLAVALDNDPKSVKKTLQRIGYDGPVWVATDGMSLIQQRFAGNDRRAVPYIVELNADGDILAARYGE